MIGKTKPPSTSESYYETISEQVKLGDGLPYHCRRFVSVSNDGTALDHMYTYVNQDQGLYTLLAYGKAGSSSWHSTYVCLYSVNDYINAVANSKEPEGMQIFIMHTSSVTSISS